MIKYYQFPNPTGIMNVGLKHQWLAVSQNKKQPLIVNLLTKEYTTMQCNATQHDTTQRNAPQQNLKSYQGFISSCQFAEKNQRTEKHVNSTLNMQSAKCRLLKPPC